MPSTLFFPFANKSGGMKIKIALLFITVNQAIRKILLAELLEDFFLVARLKAGHYKVFLVKRCAHAFIEGFRCVEKNLFVIVLVHLILPFHSPGYVRTR